jgi:O-antigen/teichoic acid export membrane protein
LIIATLSLVSAFDLGLPQAVVRALSHDHDSADHRKTIWATSSVLFIATGLLSAVVVAIASYYLQVPYRAITLIFGLAVMHNLLSHYSTLPQAEGHFGYFNSKTFIVGTANTLLAAFIAWRGDGITEILTAQLLSYLIALLPLVYFSLKYFPSPWKGVASKSVAKSLITFGLKNQAGKAVGQIQSQYAKYLLAAVSPLGLSAYVIASGLVQKFAGGIAQLSSALYPASARGSGGKQITIIYRRLQLCLGLCGILVIIGYKLLGYPFLSWWLGAPQLVPLVDSLMQILVWYLAILMLTPLASTILDGRGYPEITSFFAFLTTVIEITLALILFPRFGLLSPAYAALIAVAITTPPLLIKVARVLQSNS